MRFEDAVEIILYYEGGYVNHPNDPGGETNFGISKRSFPNLDILNLTKNEAKKIYKSQYWEPLNLDVAPSKVRLVLFDCAVNQGVNKAIRILQNSLAVEVDGKLGAKTFSALCDADPDRLLHTIIMKRHLEYARLPTWKTFGAGWSKRLLEITLSSLK